MSPVTFTLPFPPSVNCLFAGKARRYPSPAYKVWRREAEFTLMAARVPKITGPVTVKLMLYPPDRRGRDADNYLKPVIDCAVRMGVIERDDMSIMRGAESVWGEPRPRERAAAVVTITPVEVHGG